MALGPGSRLGVYEITAQIGAGGMGEVYKATDTSLRRAVALKVLPAAVAADAERLARFQREAEVLAALNHPNIAAIYGLERSGATTALVMELVEGEDLTAHIARGPLPLADALPIAKQIADALEAAHEQGIIHRDLKPANVKVRDDGTVKVLDFGLAKALAPAGTSTADVATSPTLTAHGTQMGLILGTAAYMSPEQARGKVTDRRADVWAFGVVLYEMLTNRRAFGGAEISDVLAAVLKETPPLSALPAETPESIRRLLRRCLEKDRRKRLADMSAVRLEIEDANLESVMPIGIASTVPMGSRRREYLWASVALASLLGVGGLATRAWLTPAPDISTVRFEVLSPEGTSFAAGANGYPQLSPDGRTLAFVAVSGSKPLIWVRPIDSGTAWPLPGTEDAGGIFWSPDSQSIGFTAAGQAVKKVAAAGGSPQLIATEGARDAAWGAGDVILLGGGGSLRRVPAAGGQPTPETELDGSLKETAHEHPNFLPDGRHYLYVARTHRQNTYADELTVYVGTLGSKERHKLTGIASEARYSSSGHVLFVRDTTLMAQPFDVGRLELSGEAFPVGDRPIGDSALAPFSVSLKGGLAYRPSPSTPSHLTWFDQSGTLLATIGAPGKYVDPELSPDGKLVAFARGPTCLETDIWVLDLETKVPSKVTSHPTRNRAPVWSPSGRTLVFESTRDGPSNLYARDFGVVSDDKPLLKSPVTKFSPEWSHDGNYLAFSAADGPSRGLRQEIWALRMDGGLTASKGEGNLIQITQTETPSIKDNPVISPDGRWIAYQSNETGHYEIFVQSFPQPGLKRQVSTAGGRVPRWRRDSQIFYIAPDETLIAVSITSTPTGSTLEVSLARSLFKTQLVTRGERPYDVSADGRFLMSVATSEQATTPITVILNWAAGLKK